MASSMQVSTVWPALESIYFILFKYWLKFCSVEGLEKVALAISSEDKWADPGPRVVWTDHTGAARICITLKISAVCLHEPLRFLLSQKVAFQKCVLAVIKWWWHIRVGLLICCIFLKGCYSGTFEHMFNSTKWWYQQQHKGFYGVPLLLSASSVFRFTLWLQMGFVWPNA